MATEENSLCQAAALLSDPPSHFANTPDYTPKEGCTVAEMSFSYSLGLFWGEWGRG